MPQGVRPLAGVTVVDLSDEATVFGARLLAELGATVVRVEDSAGDLIRTRPPFLHDLSGVERSLAHLLFNAGKRSVALDFQRPEAWSLAGRLAASADVVIGPLARSPGMARLFDGIEAGTGVVDIVFRRGAPEEVATDLVATAAGGLLVLNGFPQDPPNYPAGELAYKQVSLVAAEAALALVLERRKTGRAGRVTVSVQEAVHWTTLQTANANFWHWHGLAPSRHSPISPGTTFRSKDGRWTSFTIHPPNWSRFVEWVESVLGAEGMRGGEWDDLGYRASQRVRVSALAGSLCERLTQAELVAEGQRRGLLVLPINSIPGIAADAHLEARGFIQETWHPQFDEPLRMPRTAFLSSAYESFAEPAPTLGQDTGEALRKLAGLSAREVAGLFAAGVAYGPRRAAGRRLPRRRPRATREERKPGAVESRQPLKGIRVLDFCWAIAGPLSTRLLGDLGADVIKVESEYRIDPIRYIGVQPPQVPASWDTNGQFNECNTNKRAITLNLNTSEGIRLARELAATADVVTSNYTPDRLDRWGLGYEELRAIRPNLIVANLAVMGIRGPNRGWRSYGSGIVAMCGLAALTGFRGRDPIGLGTLHTDFTVPHFAATQILAALIHRDRTGEGQYLELSQYEASIHLLDTELVEYLNNGTLPSRRGNRSARFVPHGVFAAAGEDRWVAIACRDDDDWGRLCHVMGRADLAGIADRTSRTDEIEAAIGAWTSSRDNWEAAAAVQAAGVPASAVEDLRDLMGRDGAMASAHREFDLPAGVSVLVREEPFTWDGERLPLQRAPRWSEHTEEILRQELGLDTEQIAALVAANVLY